MLKFTRSLAHYGHADFTATLKQEIETLRVDDLPLVPALQGCNDFADDKIQATLLKINEEPDTLRIKAGIFFLGILTGCSCADDPSPVEPQNLYCEVLFAIDKTTAIATVSLLD